MPTTGEAGRVDFRMTLVLGTVKEAPTATQLRPEAHDTPSSCTDGVGTSCTAHDAPPFCETYAPYSPTATHWVTEPHDKPHAVKRPGNDPRCVQLAPPSVVSIGTDEFPTNAVAMHLEVVRQVTVSSWPRPLGVGCNVHEMPPSVLVSTTAAALGLLPTATHDVESAHDTDLTSEPEGRIVELHSRPPSFVATATG